MIITSRVLITVAIWFIFSDSNAFARRRVVQAIDAESEEDDQRKLTKSITDYLQSPTLTSRSLKKRNLLSSDIDSETMLEQHQFYTDPTNQKSFSKEVLGFVTPWNAKGYDIAVLMKNKLDFVVPVWFTVIKKASGRKEEIHIDGVNDIKKDWLQSMRSSDCSIDTTSPQTCRSSAARILPRVRFDVELRGQEEITTTVKLLKHLMDQHSFDGFTIEINLNLYELVLQIQLIMKDYGMFTVLVVPPIEIPEGGDGAKLRTALKHISANADRLAVMTYDANKGQAGPNAPLGWVKKIIQSLSFDESMRSKLLMGLPYYGWRGSEDMTADKMIVWMAATPGQFSIDWDNSAQEHLFSDGHKQCHYPTPLMLKLRLRLAEKEKVGVAIWELGQGFAAFMDIF